MTRYLIAGSGGMLGTALRGALAERDQSFTAPREQDFDITVEKDVRAVVTRFVGHGGAGGVLVNAAAYTNVERAEEDSERAFLVNDLGARLLAEAASDAGLRFVHVSTDFVFDGTKTGAYTELDAPRPLSVYGASKLAGERSVVAAYPGALIVRTAWVFGPGGANFPTKILELARTRPTLSVVTDEVGSPTYTVDLARGILGLVDAGGQGVFHLAGSGSCSRFELARETLGLAGLDVAVEGTSAALFPVKAPRPSNSVLDCSKAAAIGVAMPHWRDALARFIAAGAQA